MSGIGRGGTDVLKVDGNVVASQKMEHTTPLSLQWDENFDVGADTGMPTTARNDQNSHSFFSGCWSSMARTELYLLHS